MPHYAFLDGPYRLAMGLRALDLQDWIEVGPDFGHQMALRNRLLALRQGEVFAGLPESAAGQQEVLELLLDHLTKRFPSLYERADGALRVAGEPVRSDPQAPLLAVGRMVQEDFCLMQKGPSGYRLVAAVLCFPLHWRLADKLGRPLDAIHEPVPDFGARLAGTVERFFASLQVSRPAWRVNWSLIDTPELFRPPEDRTRPRRIDAAHAGEQLWLRVERQTLRRLPRCGDVLFGIRSHVEPLAEVTAAPAVAQALAARVREMPDAMARYKSIAGIRQPLLAYLDRRAAGDPGKISAS
ncbi:MAG: heme-dependent oxidative N-demethylase family protein [Geminicoccales bacterium]